MTNQNFRNSHILFHLKNNLLLATHCLETQRKSLIVFIKIFSKRLQNIFSNRKVD